MKRLAVFLGLIGSIAAATLTPTLRPSSSEIPCDGDCDEDGRVTIDELVKAVSIALGNASASLCSRADINGDGSVTIDELVRMVRAALHECGSTIDCRVVAPGTICRAAAGACDVPEQCQSQSAPCPPDDLDGQACLASCESSPCPSGFTCSAGVCRPIVGCAPPTCNPACAKDDAAILVSPTWQTVLEATPYAFLQGVLPLVTTDPAGGLSAKTATLLTELGIHTLCRLPSDTLVQPVAGFATETLLTTERARAAQRLVLSSSNFVAATQASSLATSLGAIVLFSDEQIPADAYVYCVGGVSSSRCATAISADSVAALLSRRTPTTNGFVVVRDTDSVVGDFRGQGLLGVYLAHARNQALAVTDKADPLAIRDELGVRAATATFADRAVTLLGSPAAIPQEFTLTEVDDSNQTHEYPEASADVHVYSDLDNDSLPESAVGRLYSFDLAGTNRQVLRSLFASRLPTSTDVSIIASDIRASRTRYSSALLFSRLFQRLGYAVNEHIHTDLREAQVDNSEYQGKLLVLYDDHGWYNWLGLNSAALHDLRGSNVLSNGCSTCLFEEHPQEDLVCSKFVDEGAASYMGMFSGGGNENVPGYVNAFMAGQPLGIAFRNFNVLVSMARVTNSLILRQQWGLLGDPLMRPGLSAPFPVSSVERNSSTQYTVHLEGFSLANRTFEYVDYTAPGTPTASFSGQAVHFFDTYGEYEIIHFTQGLLRSVEYPFWSSFLVRLRDVTHDPSTVTIDLPNAHVSHQMIGGELWIYVSHSGFDIPDREDFFQKDLTILLQ